MYTKNVFQTHSFGCYLRFMFFVISVTSANMALIAMMAAEEGVMADTLRPWAESQINYMLGDGGRSYVVGFGNNPPTQPHHRSR